MTDKKAGSAVNWTSYLVSTFGLICQLVLRNRQHLVAENLDAKNEKMKKIKISVYWPDDWKSIIITQKEYQSILNGNPLEKDGEGYSYEGEDLSNWWSFKGGLDSYLLVSYGGDGGVGYEGPLSGCEIEVIEE